MILVCLAAGLQLASAGVPFAGLAAGKSNCSQCYEDGVDALSQNKTQTAEDDFRKALSLAGNSLADQEKIMLKLADVLTLRGKTGEAQQLYNKLLTLMVKKYGASSPKIVPVLMALGSIQESAGDHTTAMGFYMRAMRINEKGYGPYSPAIAGSLHRLGTDSYIKAHRREADKKFTQSMSALLQDPALTSSSQLESLTRPDADLLKNEDNSNQDLIKDFQSDILKDGGSPVPGKSSQSVNWSGATNGLSRIQPPSEQSISQPPAGGESAFDQLSKFRLKAATQGQANEDPQIVLRGMEQPASAQTLSPAYNIVNESLFKQSHYEKGEEYYQRTIAANVDALGPNHPSVANDLTGLGQLYISEERYSDAEPLLSRALGIYDRAYGPSNILTINTRALLAGVEFHLGNTDKASDLYRSALNQGQNSLGPNSLETAHILNDLAYLYFHQGKLQDAGTFYEWALASTQGAVGEKDPLYAACLKDYAQVLRGLGRTTDATAAETRAAGILAHSSN